MRKTISRVLLFLSICTYAFTGTVNGETTQDNRTISVSSSKNLPGNPVIDTIVIRFDYKQSALFYSFTFEALDSIINILLHDTAIKLSIDGYAYKDEGTDTMCYFLSLNRAVFIQTYIIGRGVDSSRILSVKAYGRRHQKFTIKDKNGFLINCRAELRLIYPPPPLNPELADRDEDGVVDGKDKCPDVFGYKDKEGCPEKEAIIVPFAVQESDLQRMTYRVLDSIVAILRENPAFKVSIHGHAYSGEGSLSLCEMIALERAEIVKRYLISRMVHPSRIVALKSYGISRPVNPGKNPKQVLQNARAEVIIIK